MHEQPCTRITRIFLIEAIIVHGSDSVDVELCFTDGSAAAMCNVFGADFLESAGTNEYRMTNDARYRRAGFSVVIRLKDLGRLSQNHKLLTT